jgi:hypothetical protein
MSPAKRKTVHFATLVAECGEPDPYTLWTEPAKDKRFMKAVRQNRVMTIENLDGRKDQGIIGFVKEKNASYFVFPKPLNRFSGLEVNAIKYELVKQPSVTERSSRLEEAAGITKRSKAPPLKRYSVTLRYTLTLDISRQVEAKTSKQARQLALQQNPPVDLSKANRKFKIMSVHEL